MTARSATRALTGLARLYGVQTAYEDVNRKRQQATAQTLFLTLRALGAPLVEPSDALDAMRERTEELSAEGIEPVIVAWNGRLPNVQLRLSDSTAARPLRWTLRFEDGSTRTGDVIADPLPRRSARAGAPTHRVRVGGRVPLGYHDLEIDTAAGAHCARIMAPPAAAYVPNAAREWGVFMPLYAIRGRYDRGVGSFTDLEQLARWTAARGGSYIATLPLLATFLDVHFEPSPYAPVSRLFWNELFVDVARAPGWTADLAAAHDASAADPHRVDYRAVGAAQTRALRAAARAYFAGGDTTGLERFVDAHARLRDYARFRAVLDRRRESWHVWPDRLRHGTMDDGDFAPEDERYHQFAQWVADEQLGAIGRASDRDCAALYLDLPLGVHPDGYDAWREQSLFATNVSTGAPPDALFTGGQDWGFRPPDPIAQRRSGHRYFIECLRHHLRHARMIRLDHVMSLYRLYWVPAGLDARSGAYVRYPAEELFAAIALESSRHQAVVVGEDLGTVPRAVRALMERRRVLRMYVLQYELSPDSADSITPVPRDVVASVNTHDMPTLAGYTRASDLDDQHDLGLVDDAGYSEALAGRELLVQRLRARLQTADDPHALLTRMLAFLAQSPARAVLVNLEDLWLEPDPQNVPGTSTERENWRRRARLTLEQIMNDPFIVDTLGLVDRSRQAAHTRAAEGTQP